MRQAYIKKITHKCLSDTDNYTYDDVVRPGQILHVTNISGRWLDIANSETIVFFVEDMGRMVCLGGDRALGAGGVPCLKVDIWLGEGDRICIYHADSDTNDIVYLCVFGALYDLESWRNGK